MSANGMKVAKNSSMSLFECAVRFERSAVAFTALLHCAPLVFFPNPLLFFSFFILRKDKVEEKCAVSSEKPLWGGLNLKFENWGCQGVFTKFQNIRYNGNGFKTTAHRALWPHLRTAGSPRPCREQSPWQGVIIRDIITPRPLHGIACLTLAQPHGWVFSLGRSACRQDSRAGVPLGINMRG
jgi:hypothetical protein